MIASKYYIVVLDECSFS